MAETQIIGDRKDLSRSVTDPPTHGGGAVNADLIGDSMSLSRSPVAPPTHGSNMGEIQQVGDSMQLGRDTSEPWSQSPLPMTNIGGVTK